jgi:branched-chain amino acid transport system ATP-binding protein
MHEKAMEYLRLMSIEHLAEAEATTLSYGLQRRLEISRALATEPKLLLLDEPTAGMNQQESAEVAEVLRGLNARGLTLLVVEHNIKFVRDLCQEVTVINFGEKLISGTPDVVFNSQEVRDAYLGKQRDERLAAFQALRENVHRGIDMNAFNEVSQ